MRPRYYGDTVVYRYRGYLYCPYDDEEEDNVKRFHDVKIEVGGIRIRSDYCFPYSPYKAPSFELFKRWIQAGMPNREKMGGNTDDHHNKYWRKMFDAAIDKILLEDE